MRGRGCWPWKQRWPEQAEVAYQLGLCEQSLGRLDEAMAAWARVPAGSLYSERAALHRAQGAVAAGRFADVEVILRSALREPGPLAAEVRRQLARNLRFQGRLEDVARLDRGRLGWLPPTRSACSVSTRHSTWRHSRPKACGRSSTRRRGGAR